MPTQPNPIKKARLKKLYIAIIVVVLIIAAICLPIFWPLIKTLGESGDMESYLKTKYGADFVVKDIHVEGSGIGVSGSVVGEARPVADPSIHFEIWRGEDKARVLYTDLYLRALWTRQAKQKVDAFIAQLGQVASYRLEVLPGERLTYNYPDTGRVLGFEEGMRRYAGEITYTLSVKSMTNAANNEPSISELGRAFRVVEFARQRGAGKAESYYLYKNAIYNEHDTDGAPLYQFSISVTGNESIRSPYDLLSHFKRLR